MILIDNRILIIQSVYVYLRTYDPDSSFRIVTGLRAGRPETLDSNSHKDGPVAFLHNIQTALCPTQPPFQWVLGALSRGYSGRSMELTTDIHLVLKVKKY